MGQACITEQCRFLGIEREAEYVAIANARLRAEHARYEIGGPLPIEFPYTPERTYVDVDDADGLA